MNVGDALLCWIVVSSRSSTLDDDAVWVIPQPSPPNNEFIPLNREQNKNGITFPTSFDVTRNILHSFTLYYFVYLNHKKFGWADPGDGAATISMLAEQTHADDDDDRMVAIDRCISPDCPMLLPPPLPSQSTPSPPNSDRYFARDDCRGQHWSADDLIYPVRWFDVVSVRPNSDIPVLLLALEVTDCTVYLAWISW